MLPYYSNAFVGREMALDRIASALNLGAPLVTVHGPGGVGKTRLAIEYAHRTARQARDRSLVGFCDLSSATNRGDICATVVDALGLPAPGRQTEIPRHVGRWLAETGPPLVVLDNLEQVVDEAAALLDSWRSIAPKTGFVATSRHVLGAEIETVLPLGPLSAAASLSLFLARVPSRALAVPELTDPVLERVVRRLEGMPLAIELAASRLEILSLAELEERLQDRFRVCRDPNQAEQRRAKLSAVVSWSWELLNEAEQSGLQQLCAFVGGIPASAAVDVLKVDGTQPASLLEALREKSWLTLSDGRLEMYQTLQDFVLAKRGPPPPDALERHRAWFLDQGNQWSKAAHRRGDAIRRLSRERHNLEAVWQRFGAIDAVIALHPLWMASRPFGWISDRHDAALDGTRVLSDQQMATMLTFRGGVRRQIGKLEGSRADYQQSLDLAIACGDKPTAVMALGALGNQRSLEGDEPGARVAYVLALSRARAIPDRRLEGIALGALATWHIRVDQDHAQALSLLHEAISALEEGRDLQYLAFNLAVLAELLLDLGKDQQAMEAAERALEHSKEAPRPRAQRMALTAVAMIRHARGEFDAAKRGYHRAMRLAILLGTPHHLAVLRARLGWVLLEMDDLEAALDMCVEATEAFAALSVRYDIFAGMALVGVMAIQVQRGNLESARDGREEAFDLLKETQLAPLMLVADAALALGEARCAMATGNRVALAEHLAIAQELALVSADTVEIRCARRWLKTLQVESEKWPSQWRIASDGTWAQSPAGTDVDLSHRPQLATLLRSLLAGPQSMDAIAETIWPGERLVREAARNRIYSAVSALRGEGLPISKSDSSYLFESAIWIVERS